ncbi:thiamine phosphate synthase [Fundidesulfovibrio terrae]|uniref:thiamine phosphate synthase n=1 Tax=Fundidesulfovibrio terrae TaxID=2922866 RepID=UPI001FAE7F3F|nr:thiamine phosphate synthase [Fundidesulfovibrio terrae]
MRNFLAGGIYAILSEEHSLGRSNPDVCRELLDAGIKVVQYREKDKKSGAMYGECQLIREMTRQAGATFIINDHVDLAMMVDADGVHIGQEDLPPAAVRRLLGPGRIIGLSTHGPTQARAAQTSGVVDYLGVGPIFATKTKKDVCDPVGFEYLDYVVEHIPMPFVAIGGIKEHNLAEVRGRGAHMACLVTEIVGAQDIAGKVRSLLSIMKG